MKKNLPLRHLWSSHAPDATLGGYLLKDADRGIVKIVEDKQPGAKDVETRYETIAVSGRLALLKVQLITGRTHQIRVHMSYIGRPLAGDTLYGGSDILLRRHALHCGILAFAHPLTGEPLRVECPLPEDMAALARQEKLLTGWQLHSLPCGADPT